MYNGEKLNPSIFIEDSIREIKQQVAGDTVILGLSGGVDSTVTALLIDKAIGHKLICIFVDHGLLRKNEFEDVLAHYNGMGLNVIGVRAADRFFAACKGITDPEEKRKAIGKTFIDVFADEARKVKDAKWLAQGTLWPDIAESHSDKGVIKSHHNVGGLPDHVDFEEIIEPLRRLFKDEVRQLGMELGLPESLVWRQPFPGPGLAIRVIGEVTRDKLDILRQADAIFREEMALAGLDRTANQYFAALTNMRSVGVMGDERTYDYAVALRSVQTQDFMTATWSRLPWELLDKVSGRIVGEVPHINRVLYDVTSKPPATVEFE